MAERRTSPRQWVRGATIGSGSFGIVSLAMDTSTGSLFVVKSGSRESVAHEHQILDRLDSPHVVRCLGFEHAKKGAGDGKSHLFMEYVAGGTLSDIAAKFGGGGGGKGGLDERVVQCYTREILLGLAYLHRRGVVHGDLKCRNVLLGPSGDVKLADFGCARLLLEEEEEGRGRRWRPVCGTPLWMAPEVLRRESPGGMAADVWSLGCTVIEMATGRPPWSEELAAGTSLDPMAVVLRIACGDKTPAAPRGFSKEGVDFLKRCLERDPRRRWSCWELLHHPFIAGDDEAEAGVGARSPTSVLDLGHNSPEWEDLVEEGSGEVNRASTTADDGWLVVRC